MKWNMIKLLKSQEEKELLKAKAEAERQQKIIAELEAKERQRQDKINQVERKYQTELTHYQYRCQTFLANQDCFTRLCWFISDRGPHRTKFSDQEWEGIIKAAGLSELKDFINKTGSGPEQPPKKQVIDPLEDD